MKLIFKIKKPCDFVFSQLSNMQNFVAVHPVISKMDCVGENSYLVYETLKLGFLPYSFKYPVSIGYTANDKTIRMLATVMKLVKIEITFVLKTDSINNAYTLIEENVVFQSILPVSFLMKRIFKKQHKLLFENIEKLERQ